MDWYPDDDDYYLDYDYLYDIYDDCEDDYYLDFEDEDDFYDEEYEKGFEREEEEYDCDVYYEYECEQFEEYEQSLYKSERHKRKLFRVSKSGRPLYSVHDFRMIRAIYDDKPGCFNKKRRKGKRWIDGKT